MVDFYSELEAIPLKYKLAAAMVLAVHGLGSGVISPHMAALEDSPQFYKLLLSLSKELQSVGNKQSSID